MEDASLLCSSSYLCGYLCNRSSWCSYWRFSGLLVHGNVNVSCLLLSVLTGEAQLQIMWKVEEEEVEFVMTNLVLWLRKAPSQGWRVQPVSILLLRV